MTTYQVPARYRAEIEAALRDVVERIQTDLAVPGVVPDFMLDPRRAGHVRVTIADVEAPVST